MSQMIRSISPADMAEILDIERESYVTPWSERMFVSEFGNELGIISGYELDGRLVGYIFAWIIFEDLHINNIAVAYRARRQGIGMTLMKHAVETARLQGGKKALLEVRPSNTAAQEMYAKIGFKLVTTRKNYYTDTNEDALILMAHFEEMKW